MQFKASDADDEIDEAVQEEDLELNKELMLLPLGLLKPDVAFVSVVWVCVENSLGAFRCSKRRVTYGRCRFCRSASQL